MILISGFGTRPMLLAAAKAYHCFEIKVMNLDDSLRPRFHHLSRASQASFSSYIVL